MVLLLVVQEGFSRDLIAAVAVIGAEAGQLRRKQKGRLGVSITVRNEQTPNQSPDPVSMEGQKKTYQCNLQNDRQDTNIIFLSFTIPLLKILSKFVIFV